MLTFFDGLRWDMLADGLQVLMCTLILVCLMHNKLRNKQLLPASARAGVAPLFSQEVRLEALRQIAEQGLASIRTAVENEQIRLQQLTGTTAASWTPPPGPATETSAEPRPFRLGDSSPFEPNALGNPYAQLSELAGQGLSVRQIATQTRLPAGEVELALKLSGQALENEAAAMTRQ